MPHPIDDIAAEYVKKLDELQNVERQLKGAAALQEHKERLETELADMRAQMGAAAKERNHG